MPLTHWVQCGGQSDVINSEPKPDYQLEVQTSFYWATESNQANRNSAYQLELPVVLLKVSNVVHISLLQKYTVEGDGIGTI